MRHSQFAKGSAATWCLALCVTTSAAGSLVRPAVAEDIRAVQEARKTWDNVNASLDGRRWRLRMRTFPVSPESVEQLRAGMSAPIEGGRQQPASRLADVIRRIPQPPPQATNDWMIEFVQVGLRSLETKEPSAGFSGWPLKGPRTHPPIQRLLDSGIDLLYIPINADHASGAVLAHTRQPIVSMNLEYAAAPVFWVLSTPSQSEVLQSPMGDLLRLSWTSPEAAVDLVVHPKLEFLPLRARYVARRDVNDETAWDTAIEYGADLGAAIPQLVVTLSQERRESAQVTITETLSIDALNENEMDLRVTLPKDGAIVDQGPPTRQFPAGAAASWPPEVQSLARVAERGPDATSTATPSARSSPPWLAVICLALGAAGFLLALRMRRRRSDA